MRALAIALIGALLCMSDAFAEGHDDCAVAAHLVTADYPLPQVAAAIANKQLNIVVVGTASSLLADPAGKQEAYPSRLEAALSKQLPGVKVKVTTYAKPRTTAEEMEKEIEHIVSTDKPALLIWQTGTVDAIRRVDTETFRSAIEDGIEAIQAGKSDVVLMNPQYSPAHGIHDRGATVRGSHAVRCVAARSAPVRPLRRDAPMGRKRHVRFRGGNEKNRYGRTRSPVHCGAVGGSDREGGEYDRAGSARPSLIK